MMKRFLVPALLVACAVGTAKAGPVGSQVFNDNGTTTVNTGDINTATMFTFGDLVTTGGQSGIFVGMPTQNFLAQSFSLDSSTNFSISSTAFGTFTSTSITEAVNMPGFVGIYILGNYNPGTIDSADSGTSFPASFSVGFTQSSAGNGAISGSGTFTVPPANAPDPPGVAEPATLVMGLTSVVGGGLFHLLRRRRAKKAIA
jgi:hypothetical protein